MVPFFPKFSKAQIRWKECLRERVLEGRAHWASARLAIMAIYQHGHRSDRAGVFSVLTKAVKQVPQRGHFHSGWRLQYILFSDTIA